ncbi:MAG: hypothetical protein GIX03_07040 [Candidatus Eremiobacteraeota bacterium]|nr:hypothetical protein [Candidatus Eremiobacteraeota bacterium]MBC5802748.1 hypothetical protein [Candidatus Eremiobacteraeota bacterium]MBC5820739.1 hypothetical protein [Candidatus Eremiobacteraeota bacterium]
MLARGGAGRTLRLAPPQATSARAAALREAVAKFLTTLAHRGYSADEVAAALQRFAKV